MRSRFTTFAAASTAAFLLAACGDTETPQPEQNAYAAAYERALDAGYEGEEAKSLAQAVVNGEDVAWAFEPQTDTGG